MKPNLVEQRRVARRSRSRSSFTPQQLGRPVSEQDGVTVKQMMVSSVDTGAASNARIQGVDVAGKTGTAQNGANQPYTLWFTGFAPGERTRRSRWPSWSRTVGAAVSPASGTSIAAPIARKVIEAVLNR